jgi:CubicO group peptidase (beta-lactamase class C family)
MNGETYPAGLDPLKRSMTVEALLTMSSGLDCDDNDPNSPGNENTMEDTEGLRDYYKFTLDLKMIRPPGTKSVYCSIQPNLVGGVLAHATHRSLPDLFHDLLAQPLQINRYYLGLQPNGVPYMGGGVRLLPRDFMKFGQLVMDGGVWNGHRILSRAYATRSSSALTHIDDRQYGYFWWIYDYPYKGGTVRAFAALGNGGQVVMSIPKLDLVVEFLGANYNDKPAHFATDEYIPKYILPSIRM